MPMATLLKSTGTSHPLPHLALCPGQRPVPGSQQHLLACAHASVRMCGRCTHVTTYTVCVVFRKREALVTAPARLLWVQCQVWGAQGTLGRPDENRGELLVLPRPRRPHESFCRTTGWTSGRKSSQAGMVGSQVEVGQVLGGRVFLPPHRLSGHRGTGHGGRCC